MCKIIFYGKYIFISICDEMYKETGHFTFFYIQTQYATGTNPSHVGVTKTVLLITMINVVTKLDRRFGN